MADKLRQAARLDTLQVPLNPGEAVPAARKCWHKPQLTVLPVEQTQKGHFEGFDAGDSLSTAS